MSTIQLQIRLRNFDKLKDKVQLERVTRPAFLEIGNAIIGELQKASPVGVSIGIREGWTLRGDEDLLKIVNTRRYTKAVDMGRRPAPIPVREPLLRWVWLKLSPRTERQARALAFGIAKKAKERGIQGQNFVRPTLEQILPAKRIQAKQMVVRSLKEYLGAGQ